jgi:hypothetical protein
VILQLLQDMPYWEVLESSNNECVL